MGQVSAASRQGPATATGAGAGVAVDLEAEEAVLGGMLTSAAVLAPVLGTGITADDFAHRNRHGLIFEAAASLHRGGAHVDYITVSDFLGRREELDRVGGRDAVAALAAKVPAPGKAPDYALIVRAKAREREKVRIGQELENGLPPAAAIERLQALSPVPSSSVDRALDGAAWALDEPDEAAAVWGDREALLWAAGEPLMIVGPQGVGKTTAAQRLALHRAGIIEGDLLGMPVEIDPGRVLYIAGDRPRQAGRSFRRMVSEADRDALAAALTVWPGPLPFDLGRAEPGQLLSFVRQFGEIGTVFIDSLKDVAVKLADDEVGARVNAEHQRVIADGIELVVLHHQRKATGDNRKPKALDDVYGSTWLTAGAGSVLLLWGKPGDPIVDAYHLKQPAEEVGPLTLLHGHKLGTVAVHEPVDLRTLLADSPNGLTAHDAAVGMYGAAAPDRNEVEKARRRLKALDGVQEVRQGDGATATVTYRLDKGASRA